MSQAVRTQGDGNESPDTTAEVTTTKSNNKQPTAAEDLNIDKLGREYLAKQVQSTSSILYNPSASESESFNYPPPVQPKGKRFYLIPKLAPCKSWTPASLKNRKLNLVLMEPYRACVNPIVPYRNNENKVKVSSRNNLKLNDLVKHMNLSKNQDLLNAQKAEGGDKFMELKKERDFFESQLQFQIQVNTELKGLLVHCLGEDLQAKVNNLTEDKMKIAKSHIADTEQIEFLSSQSEVWRSKFLASSLMVEELAKVKTYLAQKNTALMSSQKLLLGTFERLRLDLGEIYQNLKFLSGVQETGLKSANVSDLTSECMNVSQQLVLNSGIPGLPTTYNWLHQLDTLTEAEKTAFRAMTMTNQVRSTADEAFRAVCSQAQQEYRRERESDFEIVDKALD